MPRIALEDAQRRLPELIASSAPDEEVETLQEDQIVARLVRVEPTRPGPRFGSAKGNILSMADDFDAPLDEFQRIHGLRLLLDTHAFLWFIAELSIKLAHITLVSSLAQHHRDPFDRMLIAQALTEGIPVLSADRAFDPYGLTRLW